MCFHEFILTAWAKRLDIAPAALKRRLQVWDLEKALSTPGKQRISADSSGKSLTNPRTGETLTVGAWARKLGIDISTLRSRLEKFSLDDALNSPIYQIRQSSKFRLSDLLVHPATKEVASLKDWLQKLEISKDTFNTRIRKGWSLEKILSTPNQNAPERVAERLAESKRSKLREEILKRQMESNRVCVDREALSEIIEDLVSSALEMRKQSPGCQIPFRRALAALLQLAGDYRSSTEEGNQLIIELRKIREQQTPEDK